MPTATARKSLRVSIATTTAATIASTTTAPPLTTTGATAARMIEPGSASSIRRTRGVTVT